MKSFPIALGLLLAPSPLLAGEVFGGVHVQDVDTVFTKGGFEKGLAVELGWRGERIDALRFIGRPSPYVFGSVSTEGGTNFAAAGFSWRVGGDLYVRPGIGIAVHDRPARVVRDGQRLDFGSRVLFEPEIAVGYQLSERVSVEASWVHLSHGQFFSAQNPGMDNIGARVNWRF